MKKFRNKLVAVALSGSILFSSCIGSFTLTHRVLDWNQSIGDKFVNEIVFVAFNIVPVYSIAMFVDGVVLNLIEFWTGSNPMAVGETRTIEGENGEYLVKTNENGYTITKGEESLELVYNEAAQSWNVVTEEGNTQLISMNEDGTVNLPNGMTVSNDFMGAMAARNLMK